MDHDALAQKSAEERLEGCYEGLEDGGAFPEGADLFCGCTTCVVREVLNAAVPHLFAGLVDLLRERGVTVPTDVEDLFELPAPGHPN